MANKPAHRRTKIVATLGPKSDSPEVIGEMVEAGMDVARINCSHGEHPEHAARITRVRDAAAAAGREVAVLVDMQGPKVRVGKMAAPVEVKRGDTFELAVGRKATGSELPSDYELLDQDVEPGHPLLIDDGTIDCEVIHVEKGLVRCRANNDGVIKARKGINLPASAVSAPAVTDKDRADALFAAQQEADFIALSFVRRAADVRELKAHLEKNGYKIPVVAKLEKPQSLENLTDILDVSFGVMVARGDLGVELLPEEVPVAQKRIIRRANQDARPVITATQMLDSMRHNLRPTRAEASDVANAVLDGTDAVMLSGETAVGDHPAHTVHMMDRIIRAAEETHPGPPEMTIVTTPAAVADASVNVAEHLDAKALVAFTRSGTTAVLVSQNRPMMPLIAFTPSLDVQRRLALVWGVSAHILPNTESVDERVRLMDEALIKRNLAQIGDRLVLAMGPPIAKPGQTSTMIVHCVGDAAIGR